MKEYHTVVIGGGPIGLTVARLVSKAGFNVCVVEKNKEIGFPNHCSGLVSKRFVSKYPEAKKTLLNGIKGAYLQVGNALLRFKDENRDHAFVIDREKFDKLLSEEALKEGVKILKKEQPESARFSKEYAEVFLKSGKILRTQTCVISAGANSGVSRMFGFHNAPYETIHTIQTEAKVDIPDAEIVYMFANRGLFGNWFGWIIPITKSRARVGLGTDKKENLVNLLKKFFEKTELLKNATPLKKPVAWMIPIGIPENIVKKRALIVGDSAMQVKPFSGGGLFTGMRGAEIASRAIVRALQSEKTEEILQWYEKEIRKEITPVIKRGLVLRKIYKSMPDKDKEMFLKSLDNSEAKKIIVSAGDIDAPFFTGIKLLKFIGAPLAKYFMEMMRLSV